VEPIDRLLTTARTTRRGLDLDRPVAAALVDECLTVALQAPNGANRQRWHFVVIDDRSVRAAIAGHYRAASEQYLVDAPDSPDKRSAQHLAANLERVPVLVLACMTGRLAPDAGVAAQTSHHASLIPAVWSFMLAASARGLGTALTTVHLAREREVADLLGIPFGEVQQGPLVAVGHRLGPAPGPAPRRPLGEVTSRNGWRRGPA
jgi:nitroreductase